MLIALAAAFLQIGPTCLSVARGDAGTPVIEALVNSRGPFSFVLDTASSGTTLDDRRIAILQPPRDVATEKAEGMGGPLDVHLYRIASFEAGPLRLDDFTAPGVPPPDLDSHDIAGLAGIDVFGNAMAIWQPSDACVEIRRDHQPPTGWRRTDVNWIQAWKIMLPIRIGAVEGWALLDTGAQYTTLNPAFAQQLDLAADILRPGGEISGIDGRPMALMEADVSNVAVGAWRWPTKSVRTGALPVFNRLGDPALPLAIIGVDWLNDKGFAIDYDTKAVWQAPDQ